MDIKSPSSPTKAPSPIEISSNLGLPPLSSLLGLAFALENGSHCFCHPQPSHSSLESGALIIQSDLVGRSEFSCLVLLIGLSLALGYNVKGLFSFLWPNRIFLFFSLPWLILMLPSCPSVSVCNLQHHFPGTDLLLPYVKFPYLCRKEEGVSL